MDNEFSYAVSQACGKCRGSCCAEDKHVVNAYSNGFINLTKALIADPEYRNVLVSRLYKELEEARRYKAPAGQAEKRGEAIMRLASFLEEPFGMGEVHELRKVISEFMESGNLRDEPFEGRDYCSFNNAEEGCMIPEHKENLCRAFICQDATTYPKSVNVFASIPYGHRNVREYVKYLTTEVGRDQAITSVLVELAVGPPYYHATYIFGGSGMEDALRNAAERAGKQSKVVKNDPGWRNLATKHDTGQNIELMIYQGCLEGFWGTRNLSGFGLYVAQSLENGGMQRLPIVLLGHGTEDTNNESMREKHIADMKGIGFIELTD